MSGQRAQRNKKTKATNSPTDGRKHNKRLPSKQKTKEIAHKKANMTPAKLTKAKKDLISTYALKAMKKVFGSEAEAWEALANKAQDSFAHMNLLWQYRYGKPGEGDDGPKQVAKAPIINFYASGSQIEQAKETTIDIDAEEVDVDEINNEEDNTDS